MGYAPAREGEMRPVEKLRPSGYEVEKGSECLNRNAAIQWHAHNDLSREFLFSHKKSQSFQNFQKFFACNLNFIFYDFIQQTNRNRLVRMKCNCQNPAIRMEQCFMRALLPHFLKSKYFNNFCEFFRINNR